MKQIFRQDFESEFWSIFWSWSFGRYFEAEFRSGTEAEFDQDFEAEVLKIFEVEFLCCLKAVTLVRELNPWVRCAFGNACLLIFYCNAFIFYVFFVLKQAIRLHKMRTVQHQHLSWYQHKYWRRSNIYQHRFMERLFFCFLFVGGGETSQLGQFLSVLLYCVSNCIFLLWTSFL